MKKDNLNRNRNLMKENILERISYIRFKFRENRKGVFNNDRTIIKLTYALNNDNN